MWNGNSDNEAIRRSQQCTKMSKRANKRRSSTPVFTKRFGVKEMLTGDDVGRPTKSSRRALDVQGHSKFKERPRPSCESDRAVVEKVGGGWAVGQELSLAYLPHKYYVVMRTSAKLIDP